MKYILFSLALFTSFLPVVHGQSDTVFNQLDSAGLKHGYWKVYMESEDTTRPPYMWALEQYNHGKLGHNRKVFYPNGRIHQEEWRDENSGSHDKIKNYSVNGLLRYESEFSDGKIDGMTKEYDLYGRLVAEGNYKNDLREGVWRMYSPKGRLLVEADYIKDKQHGVRKVYGDNEKHELIREFEFQKDFKVAARFYENGKLIREERRTFLEAVEWQDSLEMNYGVRGLQGVTWLVIPELCTDYVVSLYTSMVVWGDTIAPPGPLPQNTIYNQLDANGIKQGLWKVMGEHWSGGSDYVPYIAGIEYYKGGQRHGVCSYFRSNGRKYEESDYCNGQLNGLFRSYAPSGILTHAHAYVDDVRDGVSSYYDIDGSLVVEQAYEKGIKQGVYRRYSRDGAILVDSRYKNGLQDGIRRIYGDDDRHDLVKELDFVKGVNVAVRNFKDGQLISERRYTYEEGLSNKRMNFPDTITDYVDPEFREEEREEQDFDALTAAGDTVWFQRDVNGLAQGFWRFNVKQLFNRGYIDLIAYMKDGKMNGPCIADYGKYIEVTQYQYYEHSLKHGPFIIYWANGRVYREGTYDEGHYKGVVKEYDQAGILVSVTMYDGLKDGAMCTYWKSGRLMSEKFYTYGLKDGVSRTFSDEDPALITSETAYREGQKLSVKQYKNGRLIKEKYYDKKGRRIRH